MDKKSRLYGASTMGIKAGTVHRLSGYSFRCIQVARPNSRDEREREIERGWGKEREFGVPSAGSNADAVAKAFPVHRSTIYRLSNGLQLATGTTVEAARSGRPPVLTDLLLVFRKDPFQRSFSCITGNSQYWRGLVET